MNIVCLTCSLFRGGSSTLLQLSSWLWMPILILVWFRLSEVKMGRIFIQHMGGTRLFSCASCETVLTNRDELISTRCDIQRTASHCNTDLTIIISTQGSLEPPGAPSCSTRWSTSSTVKCRIGWCSLEGTWLGEVIWLSGMCPNILFCNRDVYCKNCDSKLGWMYEFATEDNQRFTTIFIWAWPALYTYVCLIQYTSGTKKAKSFWKELLFKSVMALRNTPSVTDLDKSLLYTIYC